MKVLLIVAALLAASQALTIPPASVSPPPIDIGGGASPTASPPDSPAPATNDTLPPVEVNTTAAPPAVANGTDTMGPVDETSTPAAANQTTVPTMMPFQNTTMVAPAVNCTNVPLPNTEKIKDFTDMEDFRKMSESHQILFYELLAAVENCRLKPFITAETAQRVFSVSEGLPLKYIHTFFAFLSEGLSREGVVAPV